MTTRALVLGGGGVTGVAWELGVLSGLAAGGVDFSRVDVIIGTSAGSVVATHVAAEVDLEQSFADQVAGFVREIPARLGLAMLGHFAWGAMLPLTPEQFAARLGRFALAARTLPEAERRAVVAARLPVHAWPARRLLVTARDARSGELVVFDRSSEAPLVDAVAASCAVPGVWPPVTIAGRPYIDGGIWSAANVHLAAGSASVLVLAPVAIGFGRLPSVAADVRALERDGARVAVVTPDAAARRAVGRNLLDPARRAPAAHAGRAQAAQALIAVRALWPDAVR